MKYIPFIVFIFLLNLYNATAQYYPIIRKHYTPEKLLKILSDYHFTNAHIPYKSISPKTSVDDSVKNKLLSLLRHEWTDAELKAKVDNSFREDFEISYFNNVEGNSHIISEKLYYERRSSMFHKSKHDTSATVDKQYRQLYDSVYRALYDSLGLLFRNSLIKNFKESPVPDDIVLAVAHAQLKEAIPILKTDLLSTGKHYINPAVAELALARLGDTLYVNKLVRQHFAYPKTNDGILNNYYDWDYKILETIGTQESISLLSDWLDTTLKAPNNRPRDPRLFYVSGYVVASIRELIKNKSFHEGLAKIPNSALLDENSEYATAEVIMYVKNWMIANKGKYEFD